MLQNSDGDLYATVTCKLPRCEVDGNSIRLNMVNPAIGHHKYSRQQNLYEAIHKFIGQRDWKPLQPEIHIGGTTWIELFALFDTQGYRRRQGVFVIGQTKGMHARAKARHLKKGKLGSSCIAKSSIKIGLE